MAKLLKKNTISLLKELYYDPERKSFVKIMEDILRLTIYYEKLPRHYFDRYLFKKEVTNIKDYFPNDILYKKFKPFLNDMEVKDIIENKLYFDFYYRQFNISLPVIQMYNHKKMFVFNKKNIEINNEFEFKALLLEVFLKSQLIESIIIKRTYGSYGGNKVFIISRHQLEANNEIIAYLYSEVCQAGFLFQEMIKQHSELNLLNPSCLNTIRFDTFIDKDGQIDIISGYLRMSISNLHVDNISSGGCMVGIDLETGKLKRDGFSSIGTFGVKPITKHPITNTIFEGFEIPFFEEAKNLVLKAASCMPGLRLIGWDVGIGEQGAILVEGNSDYGISGNDHTDGGYRKNPIFRKVLQELNYTEWLKN